MKAFNGIASVALILTALTGVAHAQQTMDARQASDTATKIRQVTYQCQSGKKLNVRYGFNKQQLPTFAQATVNGKTRFMPINLALSDNTGTTFGDENNYSLAAGYMTLNNYNKISIVGINAPDGEFSHKGCKPVSSKKIRG